MNLYKRFAHAAMAGLVAFGVAAQGAAQSMPAKTLTVDEATFDVRVLKRALMALWEEWGQVLKYSNSR